jgi:hypothetical protein
MYNIYDTVFSNGNTEGLQNFDIFYDTAFFNIKADDEGKFVNLLLIEKIHLDYDTGMLDSPQNGIIINFGDTEIPQPIYSTGNTLVNCLLDSRNKMVYVTSLSTITDRTIPIIYSYNINTHKINKEYPIHSDETDLLGFTNYQFASSQLPLATLTDSDLSIAFKTNDSTNDFINIMNFKVSENNTSLTSYKQLSSLQNDDFMLENITSDGLNYKIDNYHGYLNYK